MAERGERDHGLLRGANRGAGGGAAFAGVGERVDGGVARRIVVGVAAAVALADAAELTRSVVGGVTVPAGTFEVCVPDAPPPEVAT